MRDDVEVVLGDLEMTLLQLESPVLLAPSELERIEQRRYRCLRRRCIEGDGALPWLELTLIRLPLIGIVDSPNCGERAQRRAIRVGRLGRVVNEAIARRHARYPEPPAVVRASDALLDSAKHVRTVHYPEPVFGHKPVLARPSDGETGGNSARNVAP
jgi:hypothetical protein